MGYSETIDQTPLDERWHLVRRLMAEESHPFFTEMREKRPVLVLPELTLAFRFADCSLILRRHDDFGVDLYKPKQGDYFMAQDDTADHWRDKSVMRAILDFEQIPKIREFVADTTARLLASGKGRCDLPQALTRAVPVAMVQQFFGFRGTDAAALTEISYWNQQDAFHNQPFDEALDADLIVSERQAANIRLGLIVGKQVLKRAIPAWFGFGKDDPVARLLMISRSGGIRFPVSKVLFNIGGLLIGAVETTSHCANNVMAELFARPDVLAEAQRLAREAPPETIDTFCLEALRLRPAFPWFFRTCHRPTELSGGTPFAQTVEPGTTVLAMTHSAMSDEASFPQPQLFDPNRAQGDNFTFGCGLHECLGRAVARPMLGEIVRQILLLPGLRPAEGMKFARGVPEHHVIAWTA